MRFRNLIIAILLPAMPAILFSQQIWPGDVNNNGIVNEVDLLYWGLAHGSAGAARAFPGTNWQAYQAPVPWAQSFPGGVNFAFADCNGDGLVDETDFYDAIEENFGLQHQPPMAEGYANAGAGNAPKLRLLPEGPAVEEGETMYIALSLEDADLPLDSFYAIALSLSYTTGLLAEDDGIDFDLEPGNWVEADNSYVEYFFHESISQGRGALAVTRTNQIPVPVQPDAIGRISIVIEDIIVGLAVDTFELRIDSVLLITSSYSVIPVVPDSVQILVVKDISLSSAENKLPASEPEFVRIYPQPARDNLVVESGIPLTHPVLIEPSGRIVTAAFTEIDAHHYRLDCNGLASGVYWLSALGERGVVHKKIIITH